MNVNWKISNFNITMRVLLLILVFELLTVNLYSQFFIVPEVEIGVSKITEVYSDRLSINVEPGDISSESIEDMWGPSWKIGLLFYYERSQFFNLHSGIQLSFISGTRSIDSYSENNSTKRVSHTTIKKSLTYLNFPITYSLKIWNMDLGIGYQYSILISANEQFKLDEKSYNGSTQTQHFKYEESTSEELLFFNDSDHGLLLLIDYSIGNKWQIGFEYYHGISNIFNYEKASDAFPGYYNENDIISSINQLTVSFKYRIALNKD